MGNYDRIAKFYDDVIGRSDTSGALIKELIQKNNPHSRSVLELGCGTGANLAYLCRDYEVTGIDISNEMLALAGKKLPGVRFENADITKFKLNKKFDNVICIYDTINHLLSFGEWKKVFKRAYEHLNPGGLFVFDINTLNKLEYLSFLSAFVYEFKDNYLVINVRKEKANVYDWDLKVFESTGRNKYELFRENIKEASFELKSIKSAIQSHFKLVKVFSEEGKRATEKSDRVYFVCKKVK